MQPEPLLTADEVRAAEQAHPGYPDSMVELMQRAGQAVADVVLERFPGRVAVVCGKGSNGGDGKLAALLLREAGRVVDVVEPGGVLGLADVIVDALFGTGFHDAPRDDATRLIDEMNARGVPVVSIDVPSGVDGSTGEVPGVAIRATVTVTMQVPKVGLAVAPGRLHAGEVVVAPIGLAVGGSVNGLVPASIAGLVPAKGRETNKYRAGSVLVVGGSPGLSGALCLCAEAAFRADAGYVMVASDPQVLPVVEARLLEAVKVPLADVFATVAKADALALGPGFGRKRGKLVRRLLEETSVPAVVDADALFELEPFRRDGPTVLTPHAGELARLLGRDTGWVAAHRLAAAQEAAERFGCVCLLKGSDTLVAAPGEGVLVSTLGVPSLATAGTGDVLTGVLAAFLAKGMDARLAAAAAAAVHGLAARLHEPQRGMIASDLLATIPRVLAGEASAVPALC